ncbi:MAG: uroporphyrinogen-III synthase [Hyphomicrobium sp.]
MRLLVTRPEPDASLLKDKLASLGHVGIVVPLLAIRYSRAQIPLNDIQALVATSRNALRALAGNPVLSKATRLPIFTVGPGTAEMAAELGFERIVPGPASARDLVPVIVSRGEPGGRPLLLLAGDRQAFDLESALEERGFTVLRKIVYRSEAVEALAPGVIADLRDGLVDGVILMSPRTAEVFVELTTAAGLDEAVRGFHYFCLSAAVANRLGVIPPASCHVAEAPNTEELLALIDRMASKSH